MSSGSKGNLLVSGVFANILFAVNKRGRMPAKKFLDTLSSQELARLLELFRRMANKGKIFNEKQFKHEKDNIYAFKKGNIRIACFQLDADWILTHGFRKKRNKWPRGELERANRIMKEHLQQVR